MRAIEVRPVVRDNGDDFVALFEAKGSPHHCWCTLYRVSSGRDLADAEKKSTMRRLVPAGTPIGVLAYAGGEPIGWCSVAPRESYVRLERSRTMPRVTPPGAPTWTVLRFFVVRAHRRGGVARALLEGAVRYACERGAEVIEGYPFDTAGISSTHRCHSSIFKAAGFQQDGKRWALTFRRPTQTS